MDAELEEFIGLLCCHPELCSALLRLLTPPELPREEPEAQPYTDE